MACIAISTKEMPLVVRRALPAAGLRSPPSDRPSMGRFRHAPEPLLIIDHELVPDTVRVMMPKPPARHAARMRATPTKAARPTRVEPVKQSVAKSDGYLAGSPARRRAPAGEKPRVRLALTHHYDCLLNKLEPEPEPPPAPARVGDGGGEGAGNHSEGAGARSRTNWRSARKVVTGRILLDGTRRKEEEEARARAQVRKLQRAVTKAMAVEKRRARDEEWEAEVDQQAVGNLVGKQANDGVGDGVGDGGGDGGGAPLAVPEWGLETQSGSSASGGAPPARVSVNSIDVAREALQQAASRRRGNARTSLRESISLPSLPTASTSRNGGRSGGGARGMLAQARMAPSESLALDDDDELLPPCGSQKEVRQQLIDFVLGSGGGHGGGGDYTSEHGPRGPAAARQRQRQNDLQQRVRAAATDFSEAHWAVVQRSGALEMLAGNQRHASEMDSAIEDLFNGRVSVAPPKRQADDAGPAWRRANKPSTAATKPPFELYKSLWAPRVQWCDAHDLHDTEEVEVQRFLNDWSGCVCMGLGKVIVRQDDEGAADDDHDGVPDEVQEVAAALWEYHDLLHRTPSLSDSNSGQRATVTPCALIDPHALVCADCRRRLHVLRVPLPGSLRCDLRQRVAPLRHRL